MVTSPECWSLLGGIFPDESVDEVPEVTRPLKLLKIHIPTCWDGQELMDDRSYYRLHDIRRSGVEIVTYDVNGTDLMDPSFDDYDEDEDTVMNNNDNNNGDGAWRLGVNTSA